MSIPYLQNFNLREWIELNKKDWGEGSVKVIWESPDYITMVGRGPTRGKNFHVGPADEIFYQLEGELYFHHMTPEGDRKVMTVGPGGLFLLPAKVPHAPRRPDENSLTLVVERKRGPEDKEYWIWFCEQCNNKLFETPPRTGAGPSNAPNLIVREANGFLRANEKIRTCSRCGEVLPPPG